jgi:hypothetical protein
VDTDRLNQWLTLGANLAVFGGIILILIQLNQNADLMRSQVMQSRAQEREAGYREMIHSDYWPVISAKRSQSADPSEYVASLTPVEFQRVRYYYLAEMMNIYGQYYQYREGYLDENIWNGATRNQIRRLLTYLPYFSPNVMMNEEFREVLDRIAEEEGLPPVPPAADDFFR